MSLKRILGLALVASFMLPLAACDDTTSVAPPPPPKQIKLHRHYKKALDGATQVGLQNNDVYDVLLASNGELWVGNQEGVTVFGNPGDTRRTDAFDQNNGLSNPKVRSLVESNGIMYVGTWGGGISAYDLTAGTWDVIDTSDGLVNDLVADMKVDDDGAIIVATNAGVSRYVPGTGEIVNYEKEAAETAVGDLLDDYVSAIEIANTPRGKEYWYMPRWESGILPEERVDHGITISRGAFNAPVTIDTVPAAMDITLYEDIDGTLSNGAGEYIHAGVAADGLQRRALIKFSLDGVVPADATVLTARLRVRNSTSGFRAAVLSLQRVVSDWGEGTSDADGDEVVGAPATAGDATWKHSFFPNTDWNTLGGDVNPALSGLIQARAPGFVTLGGLTLTGDVQNWVKGVVPNYGWMISSPDSLKKFPSRQNSTPENGPILEVTHSRFIYINQLTSDLPEPNINDIYYDEVEDLFYLAFSTKGLGVVDIPAARWTFFTMDHGLPSNVVYSVTKIGGDVWVGTQNGLARQLPNGSFQSYNRGGGLPGDRVRKLNSDRPDRLWLGLVSDGAAWVLPQTAQ